MQIGDLVWARWAEHCIGVVIGYTFDETEVECSYRIKWFWNGTTSDSLEYEEDLITVEEKCSKQAI